eukprot:3843642-Prymnesium_polylepis.2
MECVEYICMHMCMYLLHVHVHVDSARDPYVDGTETGATTYSSIYRPLNDTYPVPEAPQSRVQLVAGIKKPSH